MGFKAALMGIVNGFLHVSKKVCVRLNHGVQDDTGVGFLSAAKLSGLGHIAVVSSCLVLIVPSWKVFGANRKSFVVKSPSGRFHDHSLGQPGSTTSA